MDKRRLFDDIALIKRRLFALSTFAGFGLVGAATVYGKGLDLFILFVNCALAMLVFGGLGLVMGIVYEKVVEDSLIESYRSEARERIEILKHGETEMLEMEVPVSELKSGMAVLDKVESSEGALLVRPGAILTSRLITTLQSEGIDKVRVKAQRSR